MKSLGNDQLEFVVIMGDCAGCTSDGYCNGGGGMSSVDGTGVAETVVFVAAILTGPTNRFHISVAKGSIVRFLDS